MSGGSFVTLLAQASVVGVTGWGIALWVRGLPTLKQILERPTTPIAQLRDGPVEVAGVVEADQPVRNLRGRKCALVLVEIHSEWQTRTGKNSVTHHEVRRQTFGARSVSVFDATGTCRLSFDVEAVAVSADPVRSRREPHMINGVLESCPHYEELIVPGADLTIVEQSIRVGHKALVSGDAWPDEQEAPEGYRQGVAHAHKIVPPPERKLLVAAGSQGQLVLRLAGPLVFAAIIVATVLTLARHAFALAGQL